MSRLGFFSHLRRRRTPTRAQKMFPTSNNQTSISVHSVQTCYLTGLLKGHKVYQRVDVHMTDERMNLLLMCVCSCPHKHSCVRPSPFAFACAEPCACVWVTLDQNRSLTAAGLLLADPCLEEVTAAQPVSHWACPAVLYSH